MGFATVPTVAKVTAAGERWIAVYARISRDRDGRAENVDTQIKLAREYAAQRWPGVKIVVYCDNDLTAADPDTFRPDYHRLLGDIQAGKVREIISADHERLIRQVMEGEALIPLLRAAGLEGTWGYRDGFTSVRPGETATTRFKHVMGAEYVEGLKVKLHEKLAANAGKGIPHGGRRYGYRRGVLDNGDKTLVVDPDEKKWLWWMAERVLNGDRGPENVAQELNAQGVPTAFVWAKGTMKRERERRAAGLPGGERVAARWSSGSVVGVLTNWTVAGRRQYRGEDVGPGNWQPIFDTETHRMLRAKLLRKTRSSPRASRRRYLLSGGIRCGACGHRLTGQAKGEGTYSYRCRACFAVSINGEATDAHVTTKLLDRLDELIELQRGDDASARRRREINAELEAVEERRGLIGEMVAVGEMDRVAAVRGKAKLDATQQALLRELAALPAPDDDLPDADMVRHAWDHLNVDERRKVIFRCIERIEVAPPRRAARRLDLSRISIHGPGWEADETAPPPGATAAAWRPAPADLTDDEWALVADLVAPSGRGLRQGRPLKHSLRSLVDAALYRETTGCWWHDLPDRFPPHKTVARYHQEWVRAGTWAAACARLQAHATGQPIPAVPDGAARWRALPSDVTDDEWARVVDLVAPPHRGRSGQRGRPFKYDLRQVLNAILYREATGCVWRQLPDRYPPHRSVDRFYHQWLRDGTWPAIRDRLEHQADTPAGDTGAGAG